MNCRACGLENRPIDPSCAHCGNEIQEAEGARAKQREWEALSPALRDEQERHYAALRTRFDDHLLWLKRHRWVHMVIGGFMVSLIMNVASMFVAPETLPIDFALGAAAGYVLNYLRGGAYRGMWLFVAAAAFSIVALAPFIRMSSFWSGGFLFSAIAIMIVAALGYAMGIKMEIDHVERQVL